MLNIDRLKELEEYKCPQIEIEEVNLAKMESKEKLLYSPELPNLDEDEDFFSNYDTEALLQNHIVMKTFKTDTLIPLCYDHKGVFYSSYSNFIDYSVKYQTLYLLQIDVYRGVKVLKQNDQQHLHPIILNTESLYFRYDFNPEIGDPSWKRMAKKKEWEELRQEIEVLKKGEEITQIVQKYFTAIRSLKNEHKFNKNYAEIYNSLLEFYKMKNLFNELDDTHLKLLKSEIEASSKQITENVETIENELLKIGEMNAARNKFLKVGYYIEKNKAYPNILQYHLLTQKSEDGFRNEESVRKLEQNIFNYAKQTERNSQKTVSFLDINDPNFSNYHKKNQ